MRFSKKFAAISIVAASALVAGGAFAYWTTTGSGTGNATAASSNGVVTLAASFAGGIYPGGSKVVSFTATNIGATDLYVGTVSLSTLSTVDPVSPAGVVTNPSACAAGDFSMASVAQNIVIPHGTTTPMALPNTGTLVFANDPLLSQNDCKTASITLNVVSN